jgi:hypothetical protein
MSKPSPPYIERMRELEDRIHELEKALSRLIVSSERMLGPSHVREAERVLAGEK